MRARPHLSRENECLPKQRPGRALRAILRELRRSFDAGGIQALHATHLQSLEKSWRYRCLFRLLRLFLPITPLLTITKDLDRRVGEVGVHNASRETLAIPPLPWEARMPSPGEAEIRTAPFIVYGTHGSILTPLLLAAAIDRPDLKMIAASYIAKLGPNIAACSFPVYASARVSVKRAGRKGLVPRAMGWIAAKSEGGSERDGARERNLDSLRQAAAYLRQGGGLIIAPESRNRRQAWRPGIGVIVADLAAEPGPQTVYLVPWCIRGASVTGIFQLLSRNPLVRRAGERRFRRPIEVMLGTPLAVDQVVSEVGCDPVKIAAYLERDYRERGY